MPHHANKTSFQNGHKRGTLGKHWIVKDTSKNSEAHKGQHSSIKTEFKKGHRLSNKHIVFLREVRKGEKSHWWKGGITSLVQQIRHCFKYRQWISDIFTRDDFTCQVCGIRGGYLEADHYPKMFSTIFKENNIKTFEEAINCEELWNINNGRTLCKECHQKTDNYPKNLIKKIK